MNIVFVYRSKDGINVVDYSDAKPLEDNPKYQHISTLNAAIWIQKAIETHPELLPEADHPSVHQQTIQDRNCSSKSPGLEAI